MVNAPVELGYPYGPGTAEGEGREGDFVDLSDPSTLTGQRLDSLAAQELAAHALDSNIAFLKSLYERAQRGVQVRRYVLDNTKDYIVPVRLRPDFGEIQMVTITNRCDKPIIIGLSSNMTGVSTSLDEALYNGWQYCASATAGATAEVSFPISADEVWARIVGQPSSNSTPVIIFLYNQTLPPGRM